MCNSKIHHLSIALWAHYPSEDSCHHVCDPFTLFSLSPPTYPLVTTMLLSVSVRFFVRFCSFVAFYKVLNCTCGSCYISVGQCCCSIGPTSYLTTESSHLLFSPVVGTVHYIMFCFEFFLLGSEP